MATGMMKDGMMQSEVRKAAEENEIKMKPVLQTEQAKMPTNARQPVVKTNKTESIPEPPQPGY